MIRKFGTYAFAILMSVNLMGTAAQANWGKLQVTDGSGDGFEMHQYPLGLGKGWQAQDQLGDSFGYKKGLFGINRTTEGSVLGNGVKIHHGLISGTSVDAQSMFGDTVKSHKFLKVGPRITTVNLQGMSGLASGMLHHSANSSFNPAANGAFNGGYNGGYNGGPNSGPNSGMNGGLNSGANQIGGGNPGESLGRPGSEGSPLSSGGPVDPNAYASPPGAP